MENPVNNFTRNTPQVICELNTAEEKKNKVCQKQEMGLKLALVGGRDAESSLVSLSVCFPIKCPS